MERIEKPKGVLVPYRVLEGMEDRLKRATDKLSPWVVNSWELSQMRTTLRDILYLAHCPPAERQTRLVSVSVETLQKIGQRLDQAKRGRTTYAWYSEDEVTPLDEGGDVEEIRLAVQKILYHDCFNRKAGRSLIDGTRSNSMGPRIG
jgi:hypothetical protein